MDKSSERLAWQMLQPPRVATGNSSFGRRNKWRIFKVQDEFFTSRTHWVVFEPNKFMGPLFRCTTFEAALSSYLRFARSGEFEHRCTKHLSRDM